MPPWPLKCRAMTKGRSLALAMRLDPARRRRHRRHLFPAEALARRADQARHARCVLATDDRAARYSGLFPADMIDVVPSDTVRGRDRRCRWRAPALTLAHRHRRRAQSDAPLEARRGGRLRRLSDLAAAARRAAARHPDRDPRAERGDGPRQPLSVAPRQRDRDRLPGVLDKRPGAGGKTTRTGNPMRPAVLAAAAVPYAAPSRRAASPAGVRRQPGRAGHGRHRARRDRAA